MTARRNVLKMLAGLAGGAVSGASWSQQEFPGKLIRFVVPAPPGGGTDIMARLLANALTEAKKWQFVVENVPGAGGNLGLDRVAKAPKDGYTIAIGESSNLVINAYLYSRIPFNIETDLEPVVLVARVPLVLVVGTESRFSSLQALVDAAKQKPLSFGSAGNGTVGHLSGELWKRRLGVDMVHVPYKGAAAAITDVAGGQIDLFFASITSGLPLIKAGKVRPLAVASASRSSLMPDVPSFSELGYKDMDATVIFGIVAPHGTPAATVRRMNIEMNNALTTPSLRQALVNQGADPANSGGDVKVFADVLRQERAKWGKVVKDSGAKVD